MEQELGSIFFMKLSPEQQKNYTVLELRENMAEKIRSNHPYIKVLVVDCQLRIPSNDHEFDKIIAIHVLEHSPGLPAAIKEIYKICHKENGFFSVVIPCERGWLYSFERKISAQRIFEKRYKQSYQWFIEREHINVPQEILNEILPYFTLVSREYFPFKFTPFIWCNLCIGLTFKPRQEII